MKFFTKDILKDIAISLLIVTIIALLVMIIFYNKISIGRVIPTVEEYQLSDEIANEIQQEDEEDKETIKTYELEASDLRQYEKTKEYNKGKKNPFSTDTSTSKATTNSNTTGNTTSNSDSANSSSTNFYKDDGTK